jgi:hypothetical protein
MKLISLLPCTKSAVARPCFLKHKREIKVLTALYNQRSIPFGYLLQLLVQENQGLLLYFLESLQFLPGMPKDQETVTGSSVSNPEHVNYEI